MFFVFCTTTDICRKVLSNPDTSFKVFFTLTAERLLGGDNIVFMNGPAHKTLRKQILPLFTRRALGVYVKLQEQQIRNHMEKWLQQSEQQSELEMRPLIRDLNIDTSFSAFIGPYIGTDEKRTELSYHYMMMNEGFLAFPLYFPGTTLWSAVQSRKKVTEHLILASKLARQRMAADVEPVCLLDFWMESVKSDDPNSLGKLNDVVTDNKSADYHVAKHLLDFLFASQDASTASLVWVCHFLDEYPDVLDKVRKEQEKVRPNDETLTSELLEKMPYAYQVVKEILRFRPPATMIPQIALKDCKILDNYTVPKGSIVLPYVWSAHFEGFTNPDKFDPDRFSLERHEDIIYAKNFMAFGFGAHACLGQRYAMNHMTAFIAIMSTNVEWHRTRPGSPESQDIAYFPTIYPADGCVITMKRRQAACTKDQ
ncbi:uncharacterized protein LOC134197433 isoform X2 [Corticium candelabrum]|uniref:uncharacterized protein LOC134197433 isoform X2 n=1 Tax=Corticium candelabrum TaxID=121492 RepID=UPI002E264B47|nr:uncharacterized protein LOC134197433 isoform X2 [Corticium candelabrum]